MTSVYKFTSHHEARMPFSVTNAVNIVAAIANRNDTPARVGAGPYQKGTVVHIDQLVATAIFGRDLVFNYKESLQNPAVDDYMRKVHEKLFQIGITISPGFCFWTITKFLVDEDGFIDQSFLYSLGDMQKQGPNGMHAVTTPITEPAPSETSTAEGTVYVTWSLR